MLWQKLFVEFFRTESFQNTLYILIDGLDEAFEEERTTFLELLKDFQEHTNASGRLRVFVALVGRPELNWDIEQVLDNPIPMIQIGNKNQDDISQYVKTSIAKIKILRRVSKELRKQIVSARKFPDSFQACICEAGGLHVSKIHRIAGSPNAC